MGFYIQDDFWEAMEEQPAKVQDEVLGALARLFFTGEVAELKGVSKALFVAFRDRVLLARKRSDAGKSKRSSNDDQNGDQTDEQNANQNGDQKPIKPESKPGTNGDQNSDQNRNDLLKSERESEKEREREGEKPRKGGRFAPPTPAQVREYAEAAGLAIDAERFCDYYAAQGWKLSNGNQMRDWKAAVRNWVAREKPKGGAGDVDLGKWAKPEGSAF